jgi:hypothetical protein
MCQRDGIPDNKAVINVHTHPEDTCFSREDFAIMLEALPEVPRRCIKTVITPNFVYLTFPTVESPRLENEAMRNYLNIPKNRIAAQEEIFQENKVLEQELSLPKNIDMKTLHIAMSMLDALHISEKVKTGIYCARTGETSLERIKSVADICKILQIN